MRVKLKDPNKAAHEIIEVLEDGDAIRNDGVRLTAANKNPWYVLATIHGEQEEVGSGNVASQNRNTWFNWSHGQLRGTSYNEIKKKYQERLGDTVAD